ncbi:SH3 domain-binding protein 5-like isoform X2 [Lineus longissimus]|uniref:SH3 domain-binding protein 5-like isoform X2 n=1 Tax=Lineus longissimus TaxID=88925 RepID=UPI002B4E56F4
MAEEGAAAMSDEEDHVDPRIQIELDNLNGASEVINHLESQHDEATAKFRTMMQEASIELKQLKKKLGQCVDKARPYFECKKLAREAQLKTQKAARQFQRANSLYDAAKETITLAEQRLMQEKGRPFDSAWQEMLNHATMKVFESEREKAKSEAEHQKEATELANLELKVTLYQRKYGSSISKARHYFDLKAKHEEILEEQKQQVQNLQTSIQAAKDNYKISLQMLETISEEIHAKRREKSGVQIELPPREPGVGADSEGSVSSLEINLDSEMGSMMSYTPDPSDQENECEDEDHGASFSGANQDVKSKNNHHVRAGVLLGIQGLSLHHHPANFAPMRTDPTIPSPLGVSYPSLHDNDSQKDDSRKKSHSLLGERSSHEAADGVSIDEEYSLGEGAEFNGNGRKSRSNTLVNDDKPAKLDSS